MLLLSILSATDRAEYTRPPSTWNKGERSAAHERSSRINSYVGTAGVFNYVRVSLFLILIHNVRRCGTCVSKMIVNPSFAVTKQLYRWTGNGEISNKFTFLCNDDANLVLVSTYVTSTRPW